MTSTSTRIAGGALALGGALSLVFAGAAAAAPVNPDHVSLTVTADISPNGVQNNILYSTLAMGEDWDDANYCRFHVVDAESNPSLESIALNNIEEDTYGTQYVGSYGHVWTHESHRLDVATQELSGDYKYVTSCYTRHDEANAVAGPVVHFSVDDDGITVHGAENGDNDDDNNGNGNGNDDDGNGNGNGDSTGSLSGIFGGSSDGDSGSLGSLGS